ncbi:hypothetical protein EIP86_008627 [Pleurotus ostreatoroseus]|nr:hypothetical protein EIP86_008627 [Pleurotus ostreatoroseus]
MDVVAPAPDKLKIVNHTQYQTADHLTPTTAPSSPFELFRAWLTSVQGVVPEAEAMSLSTATASGVPSSRFVLLKEVDKRGFVFYTNYSSRKGQELSDNPYAALAWYWKEVHKQIRVVGRVERVSREESEEYFKSRPIGSRVGAWASEQSKAVTDERLAARYKEFEAKFGVDLSKGEGDVPLPDHWGGYRVLPDEIEFWAGKPSRLHDRIRYVRIPGSSDDAPEWKIERLAP